MENLNLEASLFRKRSWFENLVHFYEMKGHLYINWTKYELSQYPRKKIRGRTGGKRRILCPLEYLEEGYDSLEGLFTIESFVRRMSLYHENRFRYIQEM